MERQDEEKNSSDNKEIALFYIFNKDESKLHCTNKLMTIKAI